MMKVLVVAAALMMLATAGYAQTCEAGKITCHQWCKKYQSSTEQNACLFSLETSCKKKLGALDKCVPDTPPQK